MNPESYSVGENLPPLKQRILLGVGTDKTQHCVTTALVRQTNPMKLILKATERSLYFFFPPKHRHRQTGNLIFDHQLGILVRSGLLFASTFNSSACDSGVRTSNLGKMLHACYFIHVSRGLTGYADCRKLKMCTSFDWIDA